MEKFLLGLGTILLVLGVKMIFDARPIVKTYFSFGNENEAVLCMKILGVIMSSIGSVLIYNFIQI